MGFNNSRGKVIVHRRPARTPQNGTWNTINAKRTISKYSWADGRSRVNFSAPQPMRAKRRNFDRNSKGTSLMCRDSKSSLKNRTLFFLNDLVTRSCLMSKSTRMSSPILIKTEPLISQAWTPSQWAANPQTKIFTNSFAARAPDGV